MKRRYLHIALLACIVSVNGFAQPYIKKQKAIGGSGDDRLLTICLTKDGGLIAGGYSSSNISGEKTDTCRGSADYWVVKLDSSRKIQWDKTIGGNDMDYLFSLQQTNDGGYILGGSSYSNISGEKTENSRGSADWWVLKLDSIGEIEWDKTIGGSSPDILYSLQQTSDGGYILGGESWSDISGEKTENSRGASDYWVVKLDSTGKIEWDKTIGGSYQEQISSLQQTNDGGYILGGYSMSNTSGEKTGKKRGSWDYWIVKLDSSHNIQWDKTIGGNRFDELTSLQQTADGGYILGGWSTSRISGEKTEDRQGGDDYWVVKTDSLGNILWDKTIGGREYENLSSLQQTSDGGYILGGYSNSNRSDEKSEDSRGLIDYWVVKIKANGEKQWDKTIGGDANDFLYSIKEITPNHYVLGGFSLSGISGDKTQKPRGDNDYWIVWLNVKKDGTIEVSTPQSAYSLATPNSNKGFTIFPNPAKDMLHIQAIGKATYTVTNQSGKTILTKTIENSGAINTAQLPAGLYYIKNNNTGEVQKLVLEK